MAWVAVVSGTTVLALLPDKATAEDFVTTNRAEGGFAWLVPTN